MRQCEIPARKGRDPEDETVGRVWAGGRYLAIAASIAMTQVDPRFKGQRGGSRDSTSEALSPTRQAPWQAQGVGGWKRDNGFDYQASVSVARIPKPFSRRHDVPAREQGD